jgi:metal-responsive CopG/Arc/MetJ family transcriptional regulator
MGAKKINITIPAEILKEIELFCHEEDMSKSFLIREACSVYIAEIKEKKELEKKIKEMQWAAKASKILREKSEGFEDGEKGVRVIREFRDKEL